MPSLAPLRFDGSLKRALWGGRKLGERLGKPIGPVADAAEYWEVADHPAGESIVRGGPLAGRTLRQVVREFGTELLGHGFDKATAEFPLLFKWIDARAVLSIQVHPDDARAARLDPPQRGKTEAWVILEAEPGAKVYAGLRPGVDRPALEAATAAGTVPECLHAVEPRAGDCFFLPAGVVHALGAGILLAEIQQSSDVTYRLDDWGRLGADGRPRPLHVAQALEATDYAAGPVGPVVPRPSADGVERLVACGAFLLDRRRLDRPLTLGGDGEMRLLAVLSGRLSAEGDPCGTPVAAGECLLLGASLGPTRLTPAGPTTLLEIRLPPPGGMVGGRARE